MCDFSLSTRLCAIDILSALSMSDSLAMLALSRFVVALICCGCPSGIRWFYSHIALSGRMPESSAPWYHIPGYSKHLMCLLLGQGR